MTTMTEGAVDLLYDPNSIGPDCVVSSLISYGPRGSDETFDPQVGDRVTLVDHDDVVLHGRVIERDGDIVRVHVDIDVTLRHSA